MYLEEGAQVAGGTAELDEILRLRELLKRAKVEVGKACGLGRCKVFAVYSPVTTWSGEHHGDGTILMNLARMGDYQDYVVTLAHELAHEVRGPHDYHFVQELQSNIKKVLGRVYETDRAAVQRTA